MEKKQDEIDATRKRMDVLERNARRTIEDLKRDVQSQEDKLWGDIANFLRSRAFTDRVFNYGPRDCAGMSKDYKSVAKEANEIIANRIAVEVERWERETCVADSIKEAIVTKFQKDCQMYEDQIREIEGRVQTYLSSWYYASHAVK